MNMGYWVTVVSLIQVDSIAMSTGCSNDLRLFASQIFALVLHFVRLTGK